MYIFNGAYSVFYLMHHKILMNIIAYGVRICEGSEGGSRPETVSTIISLVIYIFRGHVRAYMKGNEMLFEIIIYTIVVLWVWFQCYTGEGVKIHRKRYDQENRKSRGDSNKWIKLM